MRRGREAGARDRSRGLKVLPIDRIMCSREPDQSFWHFRRTASASMAAISMK